MTKQAPPTLYVKWIPDPSEDDDGFWLASEVELAGSLAYVPKKEGNEMITVKDIKEGKEIDQPIYVDRPYIVLNNKTGDGIVLHSGTLQSIKELVSYYDDCRVEVRRHDLYLIDNTKINAERLEKKVYALMFED